MCRGWWMRVFRSIYPVFCAVCVLGGWKNDARIFLCFAHRLFGMDYADMTAQIESLRFLCSDMHEHLVWLGKALLSSR